MKTSLFKKSTLMMGALFVTGLIAMIAKVKKGATHVASSTVKKVKSTVAKIPTTKKTLKTNEKLKKAV